MSKKLTILTVLSLAGLVATAAPLTSRQALNRAYGDIRLKTQGASIADMTLASTQVMDNGVPAAYIFTKEGGEGFAILSADDLAVPVLGYSETGSIDVDNLPPSLVWWLKEYGRRVEWQGERNGSAQSNAVYAPESWTTVAPLMKTQWNQDSPYNKNCPMVNGVKAPTGCVATSFAQVMNYFQYPEKGRGRISYTDNGVIRSMSISAPFEWSKMLDKYTSGHYTTEEADAVAYLMQACGYAVQMGYGSSASGAQSYRLVEGMTTYFNYSKDAKYREREYYSPSQWAEMIYNNIKNVGPVIYDGRSIDGGHSFVCDGYDGNGYFHFNWGWGGSSDGYYVLDSLSPETQGIGGAEGGFNYSQGAVFDMRKPDGNVAPDYDNMKVMGNVTASVDNRTVTFGATNGSAAAGWGNASWRQISCEVGAILQTEDGRTVNEILGAFSNGSKSISLGVYSYYSTSNMNPVVTLPDNLQDGRYKLVVAARQTGEIEEDKPYPWQPMVYEWGNVNYCWLTVSGGKITVANANPSQLTFSGKGFGSPLYSGRNALLDVEISNKSDIELSQCFYAGLYRNGAMQYRTDYLLVSVDPNQTLDKKALVTFYTISGATATGNGTYTLQLLDAATNNVIAKFGEFEMTSTSAGFTLKLDDFSVPGSEKKDIVAGERTFSGASYINTFPKFDVELDYTVTKGYFDTSIRLIMAQYDPEENLFISTGEDYYYATPFLGEGSVEKVKIPMDMSKFAVDKVYRLTASYMQNRANRSLGNLYIAFNTVGVEEISADTDIEPEYYTLQGVRVDKPVKGSILIRRIGSKVDKVVF